MTTTPRDLHNNLNAADLAAVIAALQQQPGDADAVLADADGQPVQVFDEDTGEPMHVARVLFLIGAT